MEVHLASDQETQFSQIATHAGTDAEPLVKDAALRLLQEEGRFRVRQTRKHEIAVALGSLTYFVALKPSEKAGCSHYRATPDYEFALAPVTRPPAVQVCAALGIL